MAIQEWTPFQLSARAGIADCALIELSRNRTPEINVSRKMKILIPLAEVRVILVADIEKLENLLATSWIKFIRSSP
jgi:hypothetical protein